MNNMSVVEDVRQALQDFLAPEMRALSARFEVIETKIAALDSKLEAKFEAVDTKLDSLRKEIQGINDKLDLDRRLSKLETRQSAAQ